MSLKQKTISGIAWNSGGRALSVALRFGIMVVLVRLLVPADFGHLSMAMVFVGFGMKFSDLGFGAALVHRREIDNSHISSAFWLNVVLGACLLGIFYVLAPYIARFYGAPVVKHLVPVLGWIFVIAGVGVVPRALLQRSMRFGAIATAQVAAIVGSGGLAIVLALRGWGVWSLVAWRLAQQAIRSFWWAIAAGHRFRLRIVPASVRDILGFSLGQSGFKLVNYWSRKSDDLLIGRVIGPYGLGVYDRAYKLMLFPITNLIGVVRRVMFPALSSIQHDRARVKRIYLRATGVLGLIIFPLMAGLLTVADPFVIVLLGKKWAEVASVVEILCFVAIIQTITDPTGWIYKSQGRTDWMFYWGLGSGVVIIMAIVVGVLFGTVQAVALAYLVANLVLLYPSIVFAGKLIGMSFREVARTVAVPLACAGGMALVVWGARRLLGTAGPPWRRLVLLVGLGVVSYGALVIAVRPAAYRRLRILIQEWR